MKRKFIALLAVIMTLSAFPTAAFADTLSELRAKQNKLAEQQKSAKANLANTQAQQKSLEDEIKTLDQQVAMAEDELALLENALSEATEKYEDAVVRWDIATKEKEKQFDIFTKRVKFIHENGSMGYLKVILQSKSFTDFLSRMQYVYDIMEYDNNTLNRLKAAEEEIAATAVVMEEEKNAQEVIVMEQTTKTESLRVVLNQKAEKAKAYEQDAASYEKQIKEFEAASNEVTKLINAATASSGQSSYAYSGGKLQWPVPSRSNISSGYGNRAKPIGSGYEFHTGIDIPASYGADIIAAESGTVITAGWIRGYGYTVIINHGNGLSTLYGHCSRLVVSSGQSVNRGDVIAKIGSTGNSTGNHTHFEVRLNGKHTSPMPYLNG